MWNMIYLSKHNLSYKAKHDLLCKACFWHDAYEACEIYEVCEYIRHVKHTKHMRHVKHLKYVRHMEHLKHVMHDYNMKHNWQTLSQSPQSKSRLTTGFSLKSVFPTPIPTPNQPPRKVSKKQDTVIYPKQKLLVYIRMLWKMFWNKPRPKNHPLGVKNSRKPFNPRLLYPC